MLPVRTLRSAAPALRRLPQRRLASENLRPQDNAFTREREAVKQHAAATSGTSTSRGGTLRVL